MLSISLDHVKITRRDQQVLDCSYRVAVTKTLPPS
jgi:hypothetical protein